MKKETTTPVSKLTEILNRHNNDVVLAARELTYENRREAVISILDSRKIFSLLNQVLTNEHESNCKQDLDRLISRTGISSFLI